MRIRHPQLLTISRRPLRIAILAHALRTGGGLSVGRNMVAALGRVAPEHMYFATVPSGLGYEEVCECMPRCQALVYEHKGGRIRRLLFETFRLPRAIRRFRPDVVLALGGRGLMSPICPQALLCHDPHLFYPAKHFGRETLGRKLVKRYHKLCLAKALRTTELLLCQTRVAEQRLRRTFQYTGRTAICPNAVSETTLEGGRCQETPAALAPYADQMKLFYLTEFYAHKNLEGLVEMFHEFKSELKGIVVVLTIAPDQHPNAQKFLQSIRRLGLSDRVVNVGPLPQLELAGYFRACQALLMPTFLESFSGTYLEAMHFGLSILTSDLDFAHAVCGDAALYFDPWDARSMKNAILELKAKPGLAEQLVAKGHTQLKTLFGSWDQAAKNVLMGLQKIADK